MAAQRTLLLVARIGLATGWAALLAACGFLAVTEWSHRLPGMAATCTVAGVTLMAMSQFVFAVLVADRVFPGASRGVCIGVQGVTGGLAVLGTLVLATQLIGAMI